MSVFRINYNQIISQANNIYELSICLEKEIIRLERVLDSVKRSWKGPASRTFQRQLILLIEDLKHSRYSIASISSTISNIATKIQREDERQCDLARNCIKI